MARKKFCRITVEIFEVHGKSEKILFSRAVEEENAVPMHLAQAELFIVAHNQMFPPRETPLHKHD